MQAKKFRVKNVDYSYHPNFVQDDNEPRGYRLTGGGKWVAEWNVRTTDVNLVKLHYRRDFGTELGAQRFVAKLKKGLDENGTVEVDCSNAYYLGL